MIPLEETLKKQIIEALNLNMKPEQIDSESSLFVSGLQLDSIDALELVVLLEKNYGIKLSNIEEAKGAFGSVRALASYVDEHRSTT